MFRRVAASDFNRYFIVSIKVDSSVDGSEYGAFIVWGRGRYVELSFGTAILCDRREKEGWIKTTLELAEECVDIATFAVTNL